MFADTHVVMGIGAGDGGQLIWPLLMGVNRAKYFLMTGERVPAEEAERLGLVNFVVDDGAVVDEALALAGRLAAGPGPGDLGVEDGHQRLHADGVEHGAPAVAGLEGARCRRPTTARPSPRSRRSDHRPTPGADRA